MLAVATGVTLPLAVIVPAWATQSSVAPTAAAPAATDCAGLATAAPPATTGVTAGPDDTRTGGTFDGVPLSSSQVSTAQTIVRVGTEEKIDRRGIRIALAVAMQESSLNPDAVTGPYVGLFQQKVDPDTGMYSNGDRLSAADATRMFFAELNRRVPGYAHDSRADWEVGEVVQETRVGRNVLQWFKLSQDLLDTLDPAPATTPATPATTPATPATTGANSTTPATTTKVPVRQSGLVPFALRAGGIALAADTSVYGTDTSSEPTGTDSWTTDSYDTDTTGTDGYDPGSTETSTIENSPAQVAPTTSAGSPSTTSAARTSTSTSASTTGVTTTGQTTSTTGSTVVTTGTASTTDTTSTSTTDTTSVTDTTSTTGGSSATGWPGDGQSTDVPPVTEQPQTTGGATTSSTPTTSTSPTTATTTTSTSLEPPHDPSVPVDDPVTVPTGTDDDPQLGVDESATPPTDGPAPLDCTPDTGGRSTVFDPGMIISDAIFYNSGAMDAAAVRSFLTKTGASCQGAWCLRNLRLTTPDLPADRYCKAYQGGQNEDVAAILTKLSVACGINPQVMLVTLQKESALLTRTDVSPNSYAAAYGWHCPDTGPGGSANCDPQYAGFFNQAAGMAKQWARYRIDPDRYNYHAGQTATILWNVAESGCGGSPVYIRNTATASLYNYTPYQPNAASLAAYPGTGDSCSTYGNRNFFMLFQKYFGVTGGGASAEIVLNGVDVTIPAGPYVAAGAAGQVVKAPNARVAKALAAGFAAVGLPYVYGGGTALGADQGCARAGGALNSCQGIVGFDCSGLTSYVLGKAGVSIAAYSGTQRSGGVDVPWNQGLPGDIIGYDGHVAIYLGVINGVPYLLEAPTVGMHVQVRPVYRTNNGLPVDSVLHRYWS